MPQPNKIPLAFAASGDKNTIPESTETTGLASWREGFPAITSAPFSEGGIAPKRADFNGIFYALSQAVMWMQQGGVYVYDANTDYEAGNVVLDVGGLYVANAANGPSSAVVQPSADTTGATWKLVRLNLATQNGAGYMSANDKKLVDKIPDLGTFSRMFYSQTSGNYVAPRTGVYKITIKGGGGGGGGGLISNNYTIGASGGEGLTLVFYKTLVANQTYPYVIGAGGTAGISDSSDPIAGGNGGTTNFNNEYSCGGGYGGNTPGNRAGYGSNEFTVPTGAEYYVKYGINGFPGMMINVSGARIGQPPGAGSGGTQNSVGRAGGGGGGGGGSGADKNARAGGNGYILIEYQG